MAAIAEVIFLMIGLAFIATRARKVGIKEYLVILLFTLAQLGVLILFMYTYEQPVLLH